MKRTCLFLFAAWAIASCKQNTKNGHGDPAPIQAMASPAFPQSSLPFLFSDGNSALLSWVEQVEDSVHVLKFSRLWKGEWQAPNTIVSGKDWFVNWADFPALSENRGTLLAHILKKSSEETFSYDIRLNLLAQGTSTWKNDLVLHRDSTLTEHGFVTLLPFQEDSFLATWLDGRFTANNSGHDHGHGEEGQGAMTVRAAVIAPNGEVSQEFQLDGRTCDCCQTTAAITANGPVVVYRDRSENEVRDIYIVRHVAGEWSPPKPVHVDNWLIKGCPVNGPKAAAIQNTLAVAWFTAPNNEAQVKIAFSDDGGENFDDALVVDGSAPLGRVDVALLDNDTALVCYLDAASEGRAELKSTKVSRTQGILKTTVIAEVDASRKSGFPQMEVLGDRVYFAYTDVSDGKATVKAVFAGLNAL